MALTYVAIATTTVSAAGGASSIDFTSIPQTYTDLCIALSARSLRAANADFPQIQFNGSTTNLSARYLYADGSAQSFTDTAIYGYISANNTTASTFGSVSYYIPNYTSSNNKSVSVDTVGENNSASNGAWTMALVAGLWSNTAAITSIKLVNLNNNFAQYTTATLYGISNS